MKKFFNKIAIVLAILATGMSFSSCNTDDLLNFASLLTQVNGGSETTFYGTAKFQKDYLDSKGSWVYNPGTQTSNSNYQATLTVTGKSAIEQIMGQIQGTTVSNSCNISLGNITVDGVTLSNVQLTSVAYDNANIGDVKDEGYVYSVSYTMNGTTYTTPSDYSSTPYAYVSGSLSSSSDGTQGVLKLEVQIAIDESTQVEISYSGTSKQ